MSHALTASAFLHHAGDADDGLRIPRPPRALPLILRPPEPWWRESLRWSLLGLSASWVACELSLWLVGP